MRILKRLNRKNFLIRLSGLHRPAKQAAAAAAVILAVSLPLWGETVYRSNSIWIQMEEIAEIPEEGHALKVDEQQRYAEGYLDGELVYTRKETLENDTRIIEEEDLAAERKIISEYLNGKLIRENVQTPRSEEEIFFTYAPDGELETVEIREGQQLSHEQLFFRYRDGSLRTVYRFLDDEMLQFLTLRDRAYTVGMGQREIRETWNEDFLKREVFHDEELVTEYEKRTEADKEIITEKNHRTGEFTRQVYEQDLLISETTERAGRKEERRYAYDPDGLKIKETVEIVSGERKTVRETEFSYTEDGELAESRLKVNGELQEVSLFEDGDIIEKTIYRGGRKLITHTYD